MPRPAAGPAYLTDALAALRAEPTMAALIRAHGAPTFARTRNPFQSLARAIVYQQLAGAAAATIYGRFVALYPDLPAGGFPTPEALLATPLPRLRGAGLSQQKASYLLDLAAHFADGRIQPRRFGRLSDDEIAAALIPVKGIGRWSVDMFLMFGLNRPDVLPTGDLGVQHGMRIYFGLRGVPTPAAMERLAERWRPFRSIAAWYMWRVKENGLPAGTAKKGTRYSIRR
jgi:DNA-3-methyladenine glycosylase II